MSSQAQIPLLFLAFHDPHVINAALDGLMPFRDRIKVTVVENFSEFSHLIAPIVRSFISAGLVDRHLRYDANIGANAIPDILRTEIDLEKHEFCIVTDGDLIPYRREWLDESLKVLSRHQDVFCIGGRLDLRNLPIKMFPEAINWIPPFVDCGEYLESLNGGHFWLFRGIELKQLMFFLDECNLEFRDTIAHEYCYGTLHKRWAITKYSSFRHLTWDVYLSPENPYTIYKSSKSFEEHWHGRKYSNWRDLTRGVPKEEESNNNGSTFPLQPIDHNNIAKWNLINTMVQLGKAELIDNLLI